MLDTAANLVISGAVGTAMKLLMMQGLRGRVATIAAMLIVTAVLVIWAVSNEVTFTRPMIWPYFLAWLELQVSAAGSFHITEEIVKASTNTQER